MAPRQYFNRHHVWTWTHVKYCKCSNNTYALARNAGAYILLCINVPYQFLRPIGKVPECSQRSSRPKYISCRKVCHDTENWTKYYSVWNVSQSTDSCRGSRPKYTSTAVRGLPPTSRTSRSNFSPDNQGVWLKTAMGVPILANGFSCTCKPTTSQFSDGVFDVTEVIFWPITALLVGRAVKSIVEDVQLHPCECILIAALAVVSSI